MMAALTEMLIKALPTRKVKFDRDNNMIIIMRDTLYHNVARLRIIWTGELQIVMLHSSYNSKNSTIFESFDIVNQSFMLESVVLAVGHIVDSEDKMLTTLRKSMGKKVRR